MRRPGFGLRRTLVGQSGAIKPELVRGEHKSLQTDRVSLTPRPESETEVVRHMYRLFVYESHTELEIANELIQRGILTDLGRAWTRGSVHQILIDAKYIGNNVWNRVSFKLK